MKSYRWKIKHDVTRWHRAINRLLTISSRSLLCHSTNVLSTRPSSISSNVLSHTPWGCWQWTSEGVVFISHLQQGEGRMTPLYVLKGLARRIVFNTQIVHDLKGPVTESGDICPSQTSAFGLKWVNTGKVGVFLENLTIHKICSLNPFWGLTVIFSNFVLT